MALPLCPDICRRLACIITQADLPQYQFPAQLRVSRIAPETQVTAAILVIGDEILSGRTKDKNIGYIAEYLTAIGIDLREVRVVPDIEDEIVAALNALRTRYTYVFTTGGIGPTHDDITADCGRQGVRRRHRSRSARGRAAERAFQPTAN